MNEILIENHNKVVKNGDKVYCLGDFSWGGYEKMRSVFNRLNGQKFLIRGNHDSKTTEKLNWSAVYSTKGIRVGDQYIWLSHYPHRSWNMSAHSGWHVFGHVHGRCYPWGKSCDVGVDCWDYKPVSFDELKLLMNSLDPNNAFGAGFIEKGFLWHGPTNSLREVNIS